MEDEKENKTRILEDAKKIIDKIEKENGFVKPHDLVNEARTESSPLHSYFVWDDGEAAEAYRNHQAGQLIARVRVSFENKRVRAYQSVRVIVKYDSKERVDEGYVSTARILSDEDLRWQVIKQGLKDLYGWKTKYSSYDELMDLINHSKVEELNLLVVSRKEVKSGKIR